MKHFGKAYIGSVIALYIAIFGFFEDLTIIMCIGIIIFVLMCMWIVINVIIESEKEQKRRKSETKRGGK